jgi:predicted TIM-barrel fold metal-dependent hydrolase
MGRRFDVKLTRLGHELCDAISEFSIVDAHEHLPSEATYLSHEYSGPNLFAGGYVWHDLRSAGADDALIDSLRDGGERPVETWWPMMRPFWAHVRHSCYARALLVTVRDVFGIPDNTPGLYHRVLQDQCGIRCSITLAEELPLPPDPGLRAIVYLFPWLYGTFPDALAKLGEGSTKTLDDAVVAVQQTLRRGLSAGAIGFKMHAGAFRPPDAAAAAADLEEAHRRPGGPEAYPALRDYLFDKCCDVAAEADVPVAVHTGYWGDFRDLDPKFMLGFAMRRRDVRFDMFHLGVPMYRDALLIGKNLPNVTLNLTWCPIISQVQTRRSLDELLDLVPVNKVIAFGGDYRVAVQKVYGHLVMAREVVAAALADRIAAGDFDREEALRIAHLWFVDNPTRVYGLSNG